MMETEKIKQVPLSIGQRNINQGKMKNKLRMGLVQIPVAPNGTYCGESENNYLCHKDD